MKKSSKFSPEVRERAVRMVQEHRGEYPSMWAAIESIAPKIGCGAAALLDWVKQAEVDAGNVLVWPQPRRNAPRVEPICRVLRIAPSAYRLHAARSRDPSKRGALRDHQQPVQGRGDPLAHLEAPSAVHRSSQGLMTLSPAA